MKGYPQLTQEQRYQISILMKAAHTQTEIADLLGVHKSTISRECTGQVIPDTFIRAFS